MVIGQNDFPADFCRKLFRSIWHIKLWTCEPNEFQHECEVFPKEPSKAARIQGVDAHILTACIPVHRACGESWGWEKLGNLQSLSWESRVQGVRVSSVLPEFWSSCPLPLLTLSCSALSLLALCCPIGNDEWILGGNRSGSRSKLYHQFCGLGQVTPCSESLFTSRTFSVNPVPKGQVPNN